MPSRLSAEQPLLEPLRVLDLTNERGHLCGKVLGDLGADVIKVEPPGGDPDRMHPPYYHDEPHPERSLRWWSANASKRSVTLDIARPEGRALFLRMVEGADFVLESFDPGHLASLGLGWDDLRAVNPRVILVSMTPYGQHGPRIHEKTSDLVLMSTGGMTYLCGDPGSPPVAIAVPQAWYHLGAQAAEAALLAHFARKRSGRGEHVDVSGQACVVWTLLSETPMADEGFHNASTRRSGAARQRGALTSHAVFPCKDGYVSFIASGGSAFAGTIRHLISWMDDEGEAPDLLKEIDWLSWSVEAFFFLKPESEHAALQKEIDAVEAAFGAFFLTRTKEQLLAGAAKYEIMLGPMMTIDDLMRTEQLNWSGYWVPVEHEELGVTLRYPGVMARSTAGGAMVRRRPPLIGEHNREVFAELGLAPARIDELAAAGVIGEGAR